MADPPSTPPWSTSSSTPSSPPFSAPKGPPIVRFPAAQYVPPAPKNPVKNQGTQTKLDDDKTTDEEADSLNTEFGTLKHSSFFTVGKVYNLASRFVDAHTKN
ncbi:hypothetical protein MMC28_003213 [Mycoblastus sanguinarius]|nr:hypothetical protein [Mycoblastus sanguinarius]